MNRLIAAKQKLTKKLTPSPEMKKLTQSVNYTNYAPMGQARTLKSMGKYLKPESIRAGAREAEKDMRAYSRSEAAKTAKVRARRKLTETYKRASAGFLERSKRMSEFVNKK